MQISDTIIACYHVYPEKNQPLHPFEKEIFCYSMNYKCSFFPEMTSRPARPRALLDFITRPILKGGSSGKFETRFHREIRSEQEKKFCIRNYSIQNCKNPTDHIDTLKCNKMHLHFPLLNSIKCNST